MPVGGGLALELSSNVKYNSSYLTQDDGAPYAFQPAFALVDGSIRVEGPSAHWELALIGRNLTNRYYIVTSSPRPGGPAGDLYGPLGRPRTVALQGAVRF